MRTAPRQAPADSAAPVVDDSAVASRVDAFKEVNAHLWGLPVDGAGDVDWEAARAALREAPEEASGVVDRYLLSWLAPYIGRAAREQLGEAQMPVPRRCHRAVYCGALLSRSFREEELRSGRDAWRRRMEVTVVDAADASVVRVVGANALSCVRFRGDARVRGRLRWIGYVRTSDAPHALVGGVEWDSVDAVPRYRLRYADSTTDVAGVVHDGVVHGERLFHQLQHGAARCTCEYVCDLEPIGAAGAEGEVLPVAPCRLPRAPSLLRALFRTFKADILSVLPPCMAEIVCSAATPWLLQQFVLFLQSNKAVTGVTKGIVLFSLFALVNFVKPLVFNKEVQRGRRMSSLFRASTMGLIFEKCLTVSPDALAHPDMSTGRILTMASSDVENIREFPTQIMFLWMAPALLLIYLFYLLTLLGWSVLAGVAVFAASLPIQGFITQAMKHQQGQLSSCTDRRLKRTNELLGGIRIVKTMGWEPKFLSAIEDEARTEELRYRRCLQLCLVGLWSSVFFTPALMIAAMLTAYTLSGHTMNASVVLPVIAIISAMTYPIMMLPEAFASLAKFVVSTRRITQFLECDDSPIAVVAAARVFGEPGVDAAAWADGATVLAAVPRALPAYAPRVGGLRGWVMRVCGSVVGRRVPVELQWLPMGGATAEAEDAAYALEDRALLTDIRLCFPRGRLTVVVGATGSGKSTLLSALLGAFRFRGCVGALPSIAYVPQQPWIMQDTVAANITFFEGAVHDGSDCSGGGAVREAPLLCSPLCVGSARVEGGTAQCGERLQYAVRCCQLEADLALLSRGLATEIGEKGINLSGGQKARVSLARAVYADRDVYLLDDPLSALDAHVGRRVMEEVVLGALAGKTRVLVTHQLQFLSHADVVVVMREGRVVFSGDFCAYSASEWRAYVEHAEEEAAIATCAVARQAEGDAAEVNEFSPVGSPVYAERGGDGDCYGDGKLLEEKDVRDTESDISVGGENRRRSALGSRASTTVPTSLNAEECDNDGGDSGNLMTVEEKETGHIPLEVYKTYFTAGGGQKSFAVILFFYFMGEVVSTMSNVWLTMWSVQHFQGRLTDVQQLLIYIFLLLLMQSIVPLTDLVFFAYTRQAASRLHATLLYTVSSATITFFDCTPLGRILNRFSKDIYVLDDELPANVIPLIGITGLIISSLFVTMYTSPLTIIVVAVASFAFVRLLGFYTTVVKEVRRRGSVVQSPLFSLLEEVVQGRMTITAYGKEHVLFAEAMRRLDLVYSCTYLEKAVTLWLAIRIEYVAALVIVAVGLIGVVEKVLDASPVMSEARVGLISLSLTMCLELSWSLAAVIELAASAEAAMNSVQRVCHYIDQVPQEALLLEPRDPAVAAVLRGGSGASVGCAKTDVAVMAGGGTAGGDAVAAFGSLELAHVDMRYRPGLPLVLRDVCFAVAPGEKVGVVGRTGSGKSTLLLAFLRLVEVCGGAMRVCGRDARDYTLPALRQLFSMIPQDPLLFDGTVRSNVDPFGEASDAEVLSALAAVGFAGAGDGGCAAACALDAVVQEGGSNFSVGQRQLLCLARALLKKGSAFILMDEATANVDAALDRQIQRTVQHAFRDHTVVTIAHRLHTVASYDKILVMAHGRVVEFGTPRALLERRDSEFHGMVTQSSAVSAAVGDAVSPEARAQEVEAVVSAFLQQCK